MVLLGCKSKGVNIPTGIFWNKIEQSKPEYTELMLTKIGVFEKCSFLGGNQITDRACPPTTPWSEAIFWEVIFSFQCAAGEKILACPPTTPLFGSDLLPIGGLGGW